ncbi:MAG: hypothetical protein JRI39_00490 [Deltaproteobacteria bacterium]|nr:hypothetical protein [Deltaproteobacteria bacterium]
MAGIPINFTGQRMNTILQSLYTNPYARMYGGANQQLPVGAAVQQPAKPTGEARGLGYLWRMLQDPKVMSWMYGVASHLANPRWNESQFSRFQNALTQGWQSVGAYNMMQQALERQRMLDEIARREQERKERSTQAQIEQGEKGLGIERERVGLERERVGLESQRVETEQRRTKAEIKAARERLALDKQQLEAQRKEAERLYRLRQKEVKLREKGLEVQRAGQETEKEYREGMLDLARKRLNFEISQAKITGGVSDDALNWAAKMVNAELQNRLPTEEPEELEQWVNRRVKDYVQQYRQYKGTGQIPTGSALEARIKEAYPDAYRGEDGKWYLDRDGQTYELRVGTK